MTISGLISPNGFHLRTLDIFKCDEVHSMDNNHFVTWMESTSSTLRSEHGRSAKVAPIIDNATWDSKLTSESEPFKRAWTKQSIVDWLTKQNIKFEIHMTRSELIQLAFSQLPPKQYIVNKYDIEIVRIPMKHCVLNLIELVWAGLKKYVRKQNIRFSLNEVAQLCNEWLAVCAPENAADYFARVYKHEEAFKLADKNAEELESDLIDSEENADSHTANDDDADD